MNLEEKGLEFKRIDIIFLFLGIFLWSLKKFGGMEVIGWEKGS